MTAEPGYGRPWAPKPGIVPLRPLTVGEILDGSFTAMRWNPKAVLIPSVIVAVVTGVLYGVVAYLAQRGIFADLHLAQQGGQAAPGAVRQTGENILVTAAAEGAFAIVRAVAIAVLVSFLTGVIGQAVLGRKETLSSAWRAIRPRIGPVIAVLLLTAVFLGLGWTVAIALSVGIGIAIGAGAHLVSLGVVLGVACAIAASVFAVIVGVRWLFAVPAVVLEHAGPMKALGRSWRLVRGSWWRVFGIMLLTWIIVVLVSGIISVPFGIGNLVATVGAMRSGGGGALSAILSAIGVIVGNAVTAPLMAGAVVVLYTDLRMRREGMDIVLRAATAPGARPTGAQPPSAPEPGAW